MPEGLVFATRQLCDDDPVSSFSCGEPALDEFFARHALGNERRGFGKTFVATTDGPVQRVLGFYTLSMANLERGTYLRLLHRTLRHGVPRYPIPVALIGRLAVDKDARGQGLGTSLLVDAFHRILAAQEHVACAGVIVDAKNQGAEGFYAKFSFKTIDPAADFPRRMFIPLATVKDAAGL